MVDRLADDHRRAKCLAEALANLPGLILDPGTPATNMIFLNLSNDTDAKSSPSDDPADAERQSPAHRLAQRLAGLGIRVGVVGPRRFRLVTHYWIDDAAVERASAGFKETLALF
jgi:threonine aldolase